MKLVATMPVRNEAYVLGLTARAALMWCDAIILFDHASTATTPDIITAVMAEHPGRVYRYRDDCATWDEMRHRQTMLEMARGVGATHIAIIDADEILTGDHLVPMSSPRTVRGSTGHGPAIWDALTCMQRGQILQLPGYNLRGSLNRYHANGLWGNRWFSVAFRDDPALSWSGDRFHHREPQGAKLKEYRPIAQHQGGIMHLWGASERRLRAKHAAYKCIERLRWPNRPVAEIDRMYSWWRAPQDVGPQEANPWTYRNVPAEWWAPYAHLLKYLDVDAEPWQDGLVRQLVAEHGAERFAGLDLFGVV